MALCDSTRRLPLTYPRLAHQAFAGHGATAAPTKQHGEGHQDPGRHEPVQRVPDVGGGGVKLDKERRGLKVRVSTTIESVVECVAGRQAR